MWVGEPEQGARYDNVIVVVRAADDIAIAREATLAVCAATGLDAEMANFLAFAVSEATTNALQYGGGQVILRVAITGNTVVAEVSDTGPGFTPAEPGQPVVDPTADHGRGLWLIGQLVDDVDIRSGPDGTRIRMTMNR